MENYEHLPNILVEIFGPLSCYVNNTIPVAVGIVIKHQEKIEIEENS